MKTPLSLADRAVYGAIAGTLGGLFGLAASFVFFFALQANPPVLSIVVASVVYFFCVGAARGADAGFFAGEAFSAIAGGAAAETGTVLGEPANADKLGTWASPLLLIGWLGIVLVLVWRG